MISVLYLTHSCPYPAHKGDRIRNFNILKYLSSRYDVKLIYPSFSLTDMHSVTQLEKYCSSVQTVKMNKFLSNMRSFRSLFIDDTLTLQYFHSNKINDLVKNTKFDIVLVDCSSMAPYVIDLDEPKIIDYVDVDYDKWHKYAEKSYFPVSMIYNREYKKLRNFEEQINYKFNHCIVISENEKNLLPDKSNITVIQNGVNLQKFYSTGEHTKNSLVFCGAMNYFANIDGVLYFHEQIFPLIKNKMRDIEFTIAGMHPVRKIRRLASKDVLITGYVPDIRRYVADASVCVVPLRIAKGMQNKVLEAMAMEVPVVATTAANRGIGARDKKEILLADSPAEFAKATLALLTDGGLRKEIAANAKQFVLNNYSWETNLMKLDAVIARVKASSTKQTLQVT
jgi:polysaccharide biosynthesis protein PslH